jgi:uncharacterized membrane protein YkvA (DUF1232 family)
MRGRTGEPLVKYAIAIAVTFALLWLLVVVGLVLARPKGMRAADAARLMPDLVLLVRDLARDRTIPRRVRVRIWILLAWMASPIDAIPDVVPVIGVLDDLILVYVVLRSVARSAGGESMARHWHGTPDGLRVVERFLGLDRSTSAGERRSADPAPRRQSD